MHGKYPSFNYPMINFESIDDYPSLWGYLYNEIYTNEKFKPKAMMNKYRYIKSYAIWSINFIICNYLGTMKHFQNKLDQ